MFHAHWRCRNCRLRNKLEVQALVADTPDCSIEINADDLEQASFQCQEVDESEAGQAAEADDNGDAELPQRDYLIDLWPFARPIRFPAEFR